MSDLIKTSDIINAIVINNRDVKLNDEYIHSLDIDQTNGNFVIAKPIKNGGTVTIYPQSPQYPQYSLLGEVKEFTQFSGYGELSYVLDTKVDYVRQALWIADAGNSRVLRINMKTFTVSMVINNIIVPHSIAIDINNGSVFVKGFKDIETGVVHHYDSGGNNLSNFEFNCDFPAEEIELISTADFAKLLPLASCMTFDHVRDRVWWTANADVHMIDLVNIEHVFQRLTDYVGSGGVDIDFATGYCFAAMLSNRNQWKMVQIFKDNNKVMSEGYIPY